MSESADPSVAQTDSSTVVYLCQVGETVSCGACCGLYNIPALSQAGLEALLARRTDEFAAVPRTEDGIDAFRQRIERHLPKEKPFPEFHHCPFIGLIGDERRRVGCLLHPAAAGNAGRDFRWLSWYGAMACRIYFCPTARILPPAYQVIIKETIGHWYLYGLIVTEHRLLAAFFQALAERLGRLPTPDDFRENPTAEALFRKFAALKIDWPFRRRNAPGPCNHVFDNGEYPRPEVYREVSTIPRSRYEDLFRELESGFSSTAEMRSAERMIDMVLWP